MKAPIFVVGLGQLGVAFAEGFLKLGYPVVPILRGEKISTAVSEHGAPELVLLAVGEDDLPHVIEQLPESLHHSVVLLQNELRPHSWQQKLGVVTPSVVIVWFEKKPGRIAQTVLSSVVFGPKQDVLLAAFEKMQLPARKVTTHEQLSHELAVKNLYILGLNLSGLVTQGTAGELLDRHFDSFSKIRDELIVLEQKALRSAPEAEFSQISLSREHLISDLHAAIMADPAHGCAGRSAPRRLERTLALASSLHVSVPTISALLP